MRKSGRFLESENVRNVPLGSQYPVKDNPETFVSFHVVPDTKRKHPRIRQERNNLFSDETNLFLLRLLQKETGLPDTLGNIPAASRDLQFELAAAIRQRVLPWFWSISLHTVLLILLALWFYPVNRIEPLDMLSGFANIPSSGDGHAVGLLGNGNGNTPSEANNSQNGLPTNSSENTSPRIVDRTLPGLVFGFGNGGNGGGGGGGGQTDEAVIAGLHWLVKVQQPNGAWHFSSRAFQQSAMPQREDALAATAMALLAFQGFGVTPGSRLPHVEDFARSVRRGWDWLLPQQNPDGSFFTERSGIAIHRFYTHAFCTIALCERLVMTGEETLREPAQRAIDYCIRHQSRRGGWRYLADPFSDQSDVSVTGWIVLALKSGEAAGLTVPPESYNRVMNFLDSMMLLSNHYMYREEEPMPSLTMTAQASFCRILLGWRRDNSRLAAGVRLILDSPPSFAEHGKRDVYYWFFATQTLYHYGGNEWQTWNSMMRETLLQLQEKRGTDAGSWNPNQPRDAWALYGRLYTTCMSLYILEVHYRHLRIFP